MVTVFEYVAFTFFLVVTNYFTYKYANYVGAVEGYEESNRTHNCLSKKYGVNDVFDKPALR